MAKQKNQPETTEVAIIIPTELSPVLKDTKIEIGKAQQHAIAFAQSMQEYITLSAVINDLNKTNPSEMDAKRAREARLKMVKVRTGAEEIKDLRKEGIKAEGDLIQALFNVVKNSCIVTETEFQEIEKHQERQEAKRQADLADNRRAQLEPFGTDTSYLPLGIMTDEQFDRLVSNEFLAFNARVEAAEKVEQARIEAERIEAERQAELARLQAERIEVERLEAIRVKEELAAKEAELVKERELAAAEQRRLDAELQAERKSAHEKFEAEQKRAQSETDRLAKLAAAEAEKLKKENEAKLKAETERLEKVAAQQLAEKQRQNDRQSAMFALGLQWDGQMFHYQDINFHWTDLLCMDDATFDKNLKGTTKRMEVLKAEQDECKRREKEADDKYKKELQELRDQEAKEIEAKRLAQLAPDKEKINALYKSIQGFTIPEFQSNEAKEIGKLVQSRMSDILTLIKTESQKLK